MKILFFGDVFGRPGREALKKNLPRIIKKYNPDFVVANIENMAHGRGITENTLKELHETNLFDAYTTGDHIWDTPVARELVEDKSIPLLRPANLADKEPGRGDLVVHKGDKKLLVINLIGQVYMDKIPAINPLHVADDILRKYTLDPKEADKEHVDGIFVDFHAEATSEKRVLGFYLDGRISGFSGTHTHVPTRDEQILPKGTAYITDSGMVGPYNSSLGLEMSGLIEEYLTEVKGKREIGTDPLVEIGGIVIEIKENGLAKSIKHIRELVDF